MTTKHAILVAAFSPGAVVVEVARQYEISTSLIYKWRSEAMPWRRGRLGFCPGRNRRRSARD